ncbi:hypothetical protein P153DRAFT_399922 [Dothidotthia symphoricarpi CBS 119687]|uniref:Uncharacterized protein n=1 Tax=Dothidotthia symphoricarpi CBS 119687 TaxID=1392245 RepID=A0A6A6A1A5_9PLEO|nr:uncharacterized protein P153DRAFT_399922 [Dothidotthia symphoricarpi CBS 119687]KAF2125782.1 hypothetical protein P153DRAFT_399922 [Dothidotthia symphoricarpi CBS 119687]
MSEHLLSTSYKSSPVVATEECLPPRYGRRRGLSYFLSHNWTVTLSFNTGLVLVGAVFVFTNWLSKQTVQCPDWAINCTVSKRVDFLTSNFGTVQGIVTTIYSIALAALAFSAHALSESALWPLLTKHQLSIAQMDTYLAASRGSIASSPFALFTVRNVDSIIVVLSTVVVTLVPLSAAPVVGQVYNMRNVSVDFQSQAQPGGGIGPVFVQTNPSGSSRESSASLYTSWQYKLSQEPMPEYREWFIDRIAFSSRGNFSAEAVRVQQDIDCRSWEAFPTKKSGDFLLFDTNMTASSGMTGKARKSKHNRHQNLVEVRDSARLAVWVHDYTFDSSTKTTATIIFAALNGTIDGGKTTFDMPDKASVVNVSSVACSIAVELVEDTLVVGDSHMTPVQINTLDKLRLPLSVDEPNRFNELALWFAVAPVANGATAYGAQPLYQYKKDWIPERFTTTTGGENNDDWTTEYIENFVRISIGAALLGEVTKWPWPVENPVKIPFTSRVFVSKMDPRFPISFLIPPWIIILAGALLMGWNVKMHRNMVIPIMRTATLSEVLKSSQTTHVLSLAALDRSDPTTTSRMDTLKVQFKKGDDGVWGLHDPKASKEYSGFD